MCDEKINKFIEKRFEFFQVTDALPRLKMLVTIRAYCVSYSFQETDPKEMKTDEYKAIKAKDPNEKSVILFGIVGLV